MSLFAIIGGSGLTNMAGFAIIDQQYGRTPFGNTSGPLSRGIMGHHEVIFLPRHGTSHTIPPHQINYRANLWALKQLGVDAVVGIATVGGISSNMQPLTIVIPQQIIDYTYGRQHTFFDQDTATYIQGQQAIASPLREVIKVTHIDFSQPYCDDLRQHLLTAATGLGEPAIFGGTYGATQGPRLETVQEICRMERDGCDIVGMTGMPEACLARELNLCYACCALVVNWAAGKGQDGNIYTQAIIPIAEIEHNLQLGMVKIQRLLGQLMIS